MYSSVLTKKLEGIRVLRIYDNDYLTDNNKLKITNVYMERQRIQLSGIHYYYNSGSI
jgi:hypothetical protein